MIRKLILTVSVLMVLSVVPVSASTPPVDGGGQWGCNMGAGGGIQFTVWDYDNFGGQSQTWCAKNDDTTDFQWDGDAEFDSSNMSWHDIGDTLNFNDRANSWAIYIDDHVPTGTFCLRLYQDEFYAENLGTGIVLDIVRLNHTHGVSQAWGQPNEISNKASSVKLLDNATYPNAC